METTMTNAADATMPRSRKRQGAKSRKTDQPKAAGTVKATIVMSRDLDFLLTGIASYRGLDRSTLAARLIEQGLKKDQPDLFQALSSFKPERAVRVKPDASGESNDRQGGASGVSSDAEEAA